MLDLRTLQVLRVRKEFQRLRPHVPDRAMDTRTQVLLADYEKFFEEFDVDHVDIHTFAPWFEAYRHPKLNDEEKSVYRQIMRRALLEDPEPGIRDGLLRKLTECKVAYDIAHKLEQWNEGDLPNLQMELADVLVSARLDIGERHLWVRPDIEAALAAEEDEAGLHWPLLCMEGCTKPIRAGDFIIVAGRPGKGKTSFLAFLIAHWVKFLDPEKNVVWLNNEGPGQRIYLRMYQAALKCNTHGLIERRNAGTLHSEYAKAVLRDDRVRVFDVHGMTTGQVTAVLEDNNPGIIVYDMLQNVKLGTGESMRSDERAEALSQWAREDQVRFGSSGICSWQISGEGANLLYPPESALKDSKTAIQGACDMILMLGSLETQGYRNVRGISVPKTKMQRIGTTGDPRCEIEFCPDTSTYKEFTASDGDDPNVEQPPDTV